MSSGGANYKRFNMCRGMDNVFIAESAKVS